MRVYPEKLDKVKVLVENAGLKHAHQLLANQR